MVRRVVVIMAVMAALAGSAVAQVTCKDAALSLHNQLRATHGADVLAWDPILEKREQDLVDKLIANGACDRALTAADHSGPGENLYQSWGTVDVSNVGDSCRAATQTWYNEVSNYQWTQTPLTSFNAYSAARKAADPTQNPTIGHFTQVVWRTADRIGCAIARQGSCVIAGCAYDNGNVGGDQGYLTNVQPAGTPVLRRPPAPTVDIGGICQLLATKDNCSPTSTTILSDTGERVARECPETCKLLLAGLPLPSLTPSPAPAPVIPAGDTIATCSQVKQFCGTPDALLGTDRIGDVCKGTCGLATTPAPAPAPAPARTPRAPYDRAQYPWKFGDRAFSLDDAKARCLAENKATGCEQAGLIWYAKCKPGWKVGVVWNCVDDGTTVSTNRKLRM